MGAKSNLYPNLSTVDVTFGDIAAAGNPVEQFKMIPTLGLWQFAFVAGFIETYSDYQKPNYLRGGDRPRSPDLGSSRPAHPRRAHHRHPLGGGSREEAQ